MSKIKGEMCWYEELRDIVHEFKDGNEEKLTKEEVADLTGIIKSKINLMEGNITVEEYLEC